MTVRAEWETYGGWHGTRPLRDPEEARELCAEIERHPDARRVLVSFTTTSGRCLTIGLGAPVSCATYQAGLDPPYFHSRGADPGADDLDFAYGGQHTELGGDALIGRTDVFRALTEFMRSGDRPESIAWEET